MPERSPQPFRFLILVVSLTSVLSGCAYRAGYGDRQIPGGHRTVAVPMFKNNTHEVGVETYFTNSLIRELERSKIGRVSSRESAAVIIEGFVDNLLFFGGSERPIPDGSTSIAYGTFRIIAFVTLRLRRNSDKRVLWEGAFKKELNYRAPSISIEALTSANALYNHSAQYQNLEIIAADMMAEAHDRLTESF